MKSFANPESYPDILLLNCRFADFTEEQKKSFLAELGFDESLPPDQLIRKRIILLIRKMLNLLIASKMGQRPREEGVCEEIINKEMSGNYSEDLGRILSRIDDLRGAQREEYNGWKPKKDPGDIYRNVSDMLDQLLS